MSATLTRRPENDVPVSDQPSKKVRRWIVVAATVALAGGVLFVTGTNTTDDSNRFAETGRHDALGRASQRVDASSDAAEFTRQLALAPVDSSTQHAENQRLAALALPVDSSVQQAEELRFAAIGAGVDTSVHFAETQRFLAVQAPVDTSHDVAEFERMQALDDTSWEVAEVRRFATLDPSDN